jgi:hypothetical protein
MSQPDAPSERRTPPQVRFWPFSQRVAVLTVPVIFIALLVGWGVCRSRLHFEDVGGGWILLGIAVLSTLPIVLLLLEGVAAQGGSVAVGTVKFALTASATRQTHVVVQRNAAPAGAIINDSGSISILEALQNARTSNVVVVDLGDGHAWWETRLLIVCAGAVRLGQPQVVVFVADSAGKPNQFLGWARVASLLDVLLTNQRYLFRFERARALSAGARIGRGYPPAVNVAIPGDRAWMIEAPASTPPETTLNPFLEEQLLAAELAPIESPPNEINESTLRTTFSTILHQRSVDQLDRDADWFRKALLQDDDYLSITDGGSYVGLMPRSAVVATVLLQLADS